MWSNWLTRAALICLAACAFVSAGAPQARADILYAATGSNGINGSLYTLDKATGAGTLIGPLVDGLLNLYGMTGLAFQPGTGVLYGATAGSSPTAARSLVTIDPTTAVVTAIGAFPFTFGDIAFDPISGKLYGARAVGGNLYTINLATGAAALVGPSNINTGSSGHGLGADASGALFTTPDGSSGNLYGYNKATGNGTIITALSNAPLGGAINALKFDENGILFGVNNDQGAPAGTELVTIDPVTGAISDLGPSVNDMDAIAFLSPTAVPEPASILLLGIGSGLGILAYCRRRRQ